MSDKTITALYDSYDQAAEAVQRLESIGIPRDDISIVGSNSDDRLSTHASRTYGTDADRSTSLADDERADDDHSGAGTGATVGTVLGGGAGLLAGLGMLAIPGLGPVVAAGWLVSTLVGAGVGAAVGGLAGALTDAGVDEGDARAYEEGVRRGGTLVTVRTSDANVDQVVDILDDHGSVDIDERQAAWRSEGWTGGYGSSDAIGAAGSTTTGLTTGMGAAAAGALGMESATDRSRASDTSTSRDTSMDRTADLGVTGTSRGDADREEVIPVAEEELQVGKREVNKGRVRIHSRTVETPVQEQVTLRQEHVDIERRPVDSTTRAGAVSGDDLFRERTIEAEERAEEAVVSKEARVKEELVVNKDVEQRTENVSDKVRRTEVEVEDERGKRITGTTDRDRT